MQLGTLSTENPWVWAHSTAATQGQHVFFVATWTGHLTCETVQISFVSQYTPDFRATIPRWESLVEPMDVSYGEA